jgi:DNA-binding transcriptional LysR family regulator
LAEPYELLGGVKHGSLDVALVYCYDVFAARWPAGVVRVPLLVESLLLLSPPRGDQPAPDLSDASGLSWVSSREDTAGARCLDALCGAAGFRPRVEFRSNDYDVIRALVAGGLGTAIVPALAHTDDGTTHARPVELPHATRTVFVTYREDNPNPLLEPVRAAFRATSKRLASSVLRPA